MSCLVAFHYRSYGTFFYTQKSSIISMVDLPTTDIIEPLKREKFLIGTTLFFYIFLQFYKNFTKNRQYI